jgi:EmrB/QacA subfamily drug resistance transporter
MGTPAARWVLLATVLGSGVAFLDGTIVNVAVPSIAKDLDASLADMQWVLDAYLVTLTALVLLGGSLGDRYGRRKVFLLGLAGFTAASTLCGLAPDVRVLIAARAVQGVGAALLVPGSLAIISAVFDPADRAKAVGAWSGLGGVASAIGPFVGGWLIDSVSWRLAFFVNVPFAVAVALAARHVPETSSGMEEHLDLRGAVAASAGLALLTYGLIEERPLLAVLGGALLVGFLVLEARSPEPMMPLGVFRNRQFSGANGTTLAVYAALGGAFFLLVVELQTELGYSALEAGSALLPVTILMLLLSARAGALAQRIGPRLPMTVGPLVVAGGLMLWTRVDAGATYVGAVLPGAVVFGLGLSLTVAPLTATIMAAAEERHLGIASGINNAVARLAGLLAVALLPTLVGLDVSSSGQPGGGFDAGVDKAMAVAAVLSIGGALVSLLTVSTVRREEDPPVARPLHQPCGSAHAASASQSVPLRRA